MKIFKNLVLLVALIVGGLQLNAQDIHFSQFYLSPLNLNPAMTGVMNCNVRLVGNYRNQWASVLKANAYSTYSASYDQKIPVGRYDFFGVGGSFWGDKAGESNFATLQGKLSASYSKRMGGYRKKSHYLVVGADAGVTQRSVDFTKLRWPNQHDNNGGFDPGKETGEEGVLYRPDFIYADVSAGLLWFTVLDDNNNFYLGGAYHHLNRANVSFNENDFESLYSKFTIHGGGEFMMGDKIGLVPGVVTMIQGPSFQTNFGTSLKFLLSGNKRNYQAFQIGAWMRLSNHFQQLDANGQPDGNASDKITKDAVILSTRFDYQDFSLGFSYDLNISKLFPATNGNGSFEFSLVYKICGAENRGVYCPNF